ncbi:MAG TPA: hypothetical protein DIU15_01790 [Deltaproteobacteria bacterium]|nr:hypothetical protein [Deltaproteobacteria bacterium]HCP44751.1 hypothetical protein [Deltaproteobacteria bacterium]|tara:strand:- start:1168 stop:1626 length:459 start_codon:yes stop_codon:yes gene_type:complete
MSVYIDRLADRLTPLADRLERALPWARLFWLSLGVVIVASFLYESTPAADIVWCVTRRVTGHPCPGCGLTRSFCAMARGDLITAFQAHLAGPLVFLAVVYGFFTPIVRRALVSPGEVTGGILGRRFVTSYWVLVAVLYLVQTGRALMDWWPL